MLDNSKKLVLHDTIYFFLNFLPHIIPLWCSLLSKGMGAKGTLGIHLRILSHTFYIFYPFKLWIAFKYLIFYTQVWSSRKKVLQTFIPVLVGKQMKIDYCTRNFTFGLSKKKIRTNSSINWAKFPTEVNVSIPWQ